MKKKQSGILFVSSLLFMISTFALSSIHGKELNADVFGYPFVFFTSNISATETSFSLLALLGNLALYTSIGFAIVTAIIKLKDFGDRNKNFRTFP